MSGVFLYVAIVAIWAFVLVPRWLRRHHAQPHTESGSADALVRDSPLGEEDYEYAAAAPEPEYYAAAPEPEYYAAAPEPEYYAAVPEPEYYAAPHADPGPVPAYTAMGRAGAAAPAQPWPALRTRSRILQARRRLLTFLMLIAAAAAGAAAAKLAPWWACVPPAGILGIYLLLLREAARADLDQARWQAAGQTEIRAARRARAQAVRQRAQAAAAAAAQPSAEVIDITGRVGDQLYDQYADATVRAVGD